MCPCFDFRLKKSTVFRTWDRGNSGLITVALKRQTRAANRGSAMWVYIATVTKAIH